MPVLPSPHLPVSPVDGAGEGVGPPAGHHVHELLEGDGRAAAGAPEHLPLLFKVKTKPNEAKKKNSKFKQSNDQFFPFLIEAEENYGFCLYLYARSWRLSIFSGGT